MSHAQLKLFLQQAGLVNAAGDTLDFNGVLRIAVSHEIPIEVVGEALNWGVPRTEKGAETIIYWQMQQAIDAGPAAREVRRAWETERGMAPSMFNRIYERFAGEPVPEEPTVAPVVVDRANDPTLVPGAGIDGAPNLAGQELLAFDAKAHSLGEDEFLAVVLKNSLGNDAKLPDVVAALVAKYGVTEERLTALAPAAAPAA